MRLTLFALLAALLTSCSYEPMIYTQPTTPAPLFEKAGDASAAIDVSYEGVDVEAAFTPVDYLGLSVLGSYNPIDESSRAQHNGHHYVEAALVGYAHDLDPTFRLEGMLGGGVGHGAGNGHHSDWPYDDSTGYDIPGVGDFTILFAQFDVGSENTDAHFLGSYRATGVSVRIERALFRNVIIGGDAYPDAAETLLIGSAFVRFGEPLWQIQLQLGVLGGLNTNVAEVFDHHDIPDTFGSIGLHVNLEELWR